MPDPYDQPLPSRTMSILRPALPRVIPVDEALRQHVSQAYWDWQSLFDRDPYVSPLQHPDYVLTELEGTRTASRLEPVLVRTGSHSECQAIGILVPKNVRTGQVGGVGPGWTLRGLRLAGGRFLAEDESYEVQLSLLLAAVR